jgi:AAA15 family ATPase/GTPase
MRLENFSYSQFDNKAEEWKFDKCSFEGVNLIVGKNAIGKTRTLNVIRGLAANLSEADTLHWKEGNYRVEFMKDNELYAYALEYHNGEVSYEELKINGNPRLTRKNDGSGKLFAEKENKYIEFQTDTNRIAALAKRDSIQHSYLDSLYKWANGVTRYDFNSKLGKDQMVLKVSDVSKLDDETKINIKDTEKAVSIYLQGKREFGNDYEQAVLEDMKCLEYDIKKVGVAGIEGLIIQSPIIIPTLPFGLYVEESDLQARTNQHEMSDGMFRALSVLLQVNYALFSGQVTCFLIDDIGEGLDFSRSSALVKRLVEKAKGSSIQLIMATNDRFIMNAVPLEYWIVLVRKGGWVRNLNYRNSKEMFDEFEKTGLNNFDFFSSGYYSREE